ncbi:MAG TPA: ABC transporter permease [Terriglobales bacterium]|nr:ABC transporter permease [Terriglobales bacterium]
MPIPSLSAFAKENVKSVQDYSLLAGRSLSNILGQPRYYADTLMQADLIGVGSLPIVVLIGLFTGAVLALQTSSTLQQFGSLSLTGKLVSLSMVRELGPVLTGILVAGRNSSGMASELGSMKVTEQIDAMRAMGVDPTKKLVTPRVIASVVMMFFLAIISDLVGLTGGFLVSYLLLGLDPNQYWTTGSQALRFGDVFMGLTKPVIFGFIIATIGCFYGLSAKGGTQGVGRATTQAVVAASVLIVVSDFFITKLLIGFFNY